MLCGIRGGKTYAGAREAVKQAWNSKVDINIPFGIVAPTFHMLDRTTWREFKNAARPLILKENDSKKIITLKNKREVFGFSAENPDKIRNVTLMGGWVDEARECKNFMELWDVLLGRVLSTDGKIFVTSSPNSFDDLHEVFVEKKQKDYGTVRFSTYENTTISKEAIDSLAQKYDSKFMEQEIMGKIVVFAGQTYYAFDRRYNAGDLAFKVSQYNPNLPLNLCCDFNVDPMAWVITQYGFTSDGLKEIRVIDEIYIRNSNTIECCNEFKSRYPTHRSGVNLYGDATGKARHTNSNITNYQIIENELGQYRVSNRVSLSNPGERDRINSVNGMICSSTQDRRVLINPKCKHLIADFEQVSYKEGTTHIDKGKNLKLTHASDALGYFIESEHSLNRELTTGIPI